MSKRLAQIEAAVLMMVTTLPVQGGETADEISDDFLEEIGRGAVQKARKFTESTELKSDDLGLKKLRHLIDVMDDEFENPTDGVAA